MALEAGDLDGFMVVAMHHARALAEHLNRTGLGTAGAEDIRIEDAERGAAKITRADALDEAGHVDVRWTGAGAWRVETIQATIRFSDSRLRR